MRKKGQITIYIILGILLVLLALLISYLSQRTAKAPIEEEIKVPSEARPVFNYVSNCLGITAKQGLLIQGLQGGYIKIPEDIEKTPTSYILADDLGVIKIPYWYYEGEERAPTKEFMQEALAKYIDENLPLCTRNFEALKGYEVTPKEKPKTSVRFVDQVTVKTNWPLRIRRDMIVTEFETYAGKLAVNMREIVETAHKVMQAENQQRFFENITIDLVSADKKVPTDGLTFECGTKKWHLQEITQRVQNTLKYNIPHIRVKNTQHLPFKEKERTYKQLADYNKQMYKEMEKGKDFVAPGNTPEDAYEYFHMYLDAGAQPTKIKTSFDYQPVWGIELNAKPNEGGVLKSNQVKGARKYLKFLCVNQWHFAYDIIYPVRAVLKDEQAFAGQGYAFQFSFPVLINENEAAREVFGYRRFTKPKYDTEFCSNQGSKEADIRAKGFNPGDLFASELKDVNITYTCFDRECELGKTKAENGAYRLTTKLPAGCANPFIKATKAGYLPEEQVLRGNRLDLTLTKLKQLKIKVNVHPYYAPTKQWLAPRELGKKETVFLRAELKNSTFEQIKEYPLDEALEFAEKDSVYNVDFVLTLGTNQIGGYVNDNLQVSYEDIADKEEVELNIVEYRPNPTTNEQKGQMIGFLREENYEQLKPQFK